MHRCRLSDVGIPVKSEAFETGAHRRIDHRRGVKKKTIQNEITNNQQLDRSKSLQIRYDLLARNVTHRPID